MKSDIFTKHNITHIDYKDTELLKRFVDQYGRIRPRRYTGVSTKHQRALARAIKQSRYMGLIPYITS